MKNPLIEKYGEDARWVNWKLEERKGKKTKIPYSPRTKRMASSTDAGTWTSFKRALHTDADHVGIVFTPEKTLLGIDIDKCLVKGKLHDDKVLELLVQANTYTEVSPSGTGLHLYLALSAPVTLIANRHEVYEAYTEGRYFTVTGKSYGPVKKVREVNVKEAIALLHLIGYPWERSEALPRSSGDKTGVKVLSKEKVLERMFAASNGAEIRKLYDADVSAYEGDASRADMAFLSHLAFWTQKDVAMMEDIWLRSPLGERKKTQQREDYRKRSIAAAIEHCTTVYSPPSRGDSKMSIDDPELNLLFTVTSNKEGDKSKAYFKNTENMTRVLLNHPEFKNTLRFDEYQTTVERRQKNGDWRGINDHDFIDIQTRISVLFKDFANINKLTIMDAIINAAFTNKVDTGADYIKSLKWDGTARLDTWLSSAYHTEADEYHRTVGANWLKGLVKRIIIPGCKFDYVLVLEGEQGIRKSSSLLALAGNLGHVETTMSTDTKDFYMQFLGNAIVEFSEGETLSRTEVKKMKALITVQTDKFRPPFGKVVLPHPRRCVFAMTTNQSEYLKDETGNRRWLPVAVIGQVDVKWIEENREQLLAEAYARVIGKSETTWEFPEKEMLRQQNARRVHDPNTERIVHWYFSLTPLQRKDGISGADAFVGALNGGFGSRPTTRTEEMGIADVFKTILLLDKRRVMIGGVRSWRWYPTEETDALLPESVPAVF